MTAGPTARSSVSEHVPSPVVAAGIRADLRRLLTSWGLPAPLVDDAVVVVEELVANVCDHARSAFRVGVRLTGSTLHVSVRDSGRGAPVVQPFDPRAVRGRGLQLVDAVALSWGCRPHPVGKTVWAELAV